MVVDRYGSVQQRFRLLYQPSKKWILNYPRCHLFDRYPSSSRPGNKEEVVRLLSLWFQGYPMYLKKKKDVSLFSLPRDLLKASSIPWPIRRFPTWLNTYITFLIKVASEMDKLGLDKYYNRVLKASHDVSIFMFFSSLLFVLLTLGYPLLWATFLLSCSLQDLSTIS